MADVRALLAAERQSRRISHPLLTYSKTGALNCNVCSLNIKSEQLWPGHLKSLNHRKNVQKRSDQLTRPAKRKIDSVESNNEEGRNYDVDSRKKPKPVHDSDPSSVPGPVQSATADLVEVEPANEETQTPVVTQEHVQPSPPREQQSSPVQPESSQNIDEDEWAAFEREVAPLTQPNLSSATIEAAPVSAAEVAASQKVNAIQERENEAEAEKEDESRRLEEEFEVMEEMEDRMKRLRARREALRPQETAEPSVSASVVGSREKDASEEQAGNSSDEVSSDENEADDWYG